MSNLIPSNPTDRAAIKAALGEISKALSEIQTHKVQINEILGSLEDKYTVSKKTFRQVAYLHHRQTVKEFEEQTAEVKELYKAVVG